MPTNRCIDGQMIQQILKLTDCKPTPDAYCAVLILNISKLRFALLYIILNTNRNFKNIFSLQNHLMTNKSWF